MDKKCINFGTIFKRSSCLNAVSESKIDSGRRYEILTNQLENLSIQDGQISPSIKNSLNSYIESLCSTSEASGNFRSALYILELLNRINKNEAEQYLNEYVNRILPYVDDFFGISETVERYELNNDQKEKILEYASKYNTADRIIKNHNTICKRFNIEAEITSNKDLRSIVESCCSKIDTYTIEPYHKLNLCIEEMSYLFEKNNITVNKSEFVSFVTEYFLLRSDRISSKDLKGYRKALQESYYLEEEDIKKVNYLFTDEESDIDSIKDYIQNFLKLQEKDTRIFNTTIENCFEKSRVLDISQKINSVLFLIWNVYKSGIFHDEYMNTAIPCWFDILIRRISDDLFFDNSDSKFTKFEINKIKDSCSEFKELIIIRDKDSYEYGIRATSFKTYIDIFIGKLMDLCSITYYKENLEAIEFVNRSNNDNIPLNEYKIFKFHNLINAAMHLDKYLGKKAKSIFDKGYTKLKKFNNNAKKFLFEEYEIYSFIGEDNKADICVAQYMINEDDSEVINKIQDELNKLCIEFNNNLIIEGYESIRSYYLINMGVAEIHIKESSSILLSNDDKKLINESEIPYLDLYIESLAKSDTNLELLESLEKIVSVEEMLSGFYNVDITLEHFDLIMETLSLLNVSKESVNAFVEQYSNYHYYQLLENCIENDDINHINKKLSEWTMNEDVPTDVQFEAYQILDALLETKKPPKVGGEAIKSSTDKTSDNNENEEKESKNPFKNLNLNKIRLYLEGLKKNAKDMTTKEKEISRNIDATFSRLVKGMKDALISDRREAIIKGSVIPSFSKCIKIGIVLAGIGLIANNPIVPAVIALGGFAVSKQLTKKERILLLDEIETELEVVEKEISNAESKNQMKKYRALLKYKKDLQRQYQRIRYNVRVGKDILPDSAAGFVNRD